MKKIPFSPPDIGLEEIEEVTQTLMSGWITTGPRTKEFERQIAAFCGVNKAVCLNSATACLEAILHILDIGPGDEVIVPAYTYTASASPIYHLGAKIVFVDIQENCLEMDYGQMERAITERTKAIVPVDLAGIVCDYERIFEIVERHRDEFVPSGKIQEALGRIAVVADAAHAIGAKKVFRGEWHMCGNIADFTSFSFHAVKNLTTAEGGALTWKPLKGVDDEWLYKQFMLYSLHGQSKDALAKTQLGAWEYDIISPAYKCNMTDIMAAIGLVQLRRYPELLKKRREFVERYDEALRPLGIKTLNHYTTDSISSGHLYLIRIPGIGVEKRNEIITKLAEKGVAVNVHYKPLPMMTAYKRMGFDIKDFPNAYKMYENEVTLPLHTLLSMEDVEYIIENCKSVIEG